ncbi:EthD family reductase [Paludibacterium sp.]|uniref:EthD family reductase n=1 Tax=Paludibacterium sp. TaxID=1917523 RepID=UPI0025DFCD87|nr:EthD family reductase [Paludibacterium sp.]
MITLLYPYKEHARFDFAYYLGTHVPFVKRCVGPTLKGIVIEKGLVGIMPDIPPPFLVIAHLYFESIKSFENTFGAHAKEIFADIPNFTDLQPLAMISEVIAE